jgi:hypothetical protein
MITKAYHLRRRLHAADPRLGAAMRLLQVPESTQPKRVRLNFLEVAFGAA